MTNPKCEQRGTTEELICELGKKLESGMHPCVTVHVRERSQRAITVALSMRVGVEREVSAEALPGVIDHSEAFAIDMSMELARQLRVAAGELEAKRE